ncbi:MAG: hypothetical protein Q9203_006934, partial [Teloschistes exilis]
MMSKEMEQSSSANTQEGPLDPIVNLHFWTYLQVIKHGPFPRLLIPIFYEGPFLPVLPGATNMASKDINEILDEQFKYLGVDPSTVPQQSLKLKIDMLGAVLEEHQATLSEPESSKTGEARQRLELDATALNEMTLAIRGKAKEVMIKKKAEEARKKAEEAAAGPSNTDQTEPESIAREEEDEEIDVEAWMATRTTDEERRADIEERFKRFWELADETKKFPKKLENRKKWWDESKAALAQTLAQIKEFEPQRSVHQRGIRNQERLIADVSASLRALYAEHTVQHPATTNPATATRDALISRTTSDPVRGTILRSTTVFTTAKPGHACFWPEIQHQTSLFLREGQHLRWQLRNEHNLHARHARLQHATKERARRLREKVVEWDKQRARLYGALLEIEAMEAVAG